MATYCGDCGNRRDARCTDSCSGGNRGYFMYVDGQPYCNYKKQKIGNASGCLCRSEVFYCQDLRRICTSSESAYRTCSKNRQ
ncbi:MAG: hypothetical protein ACM3UU_03490 [Ignavibacteriales bacterium]